MSLRAVSLVGLLFTFASLAGVAVGAHSVAGDTVIRETNSAAADRGVAPASGAGTTAVSAGAPAEAGGTIAPLLLLEATSDPAAPVAGENYALEVTLQNAGDTDVAFLLDAESYVEVTPGEWRKDPQRFQDGLSIEAGATRTFTFHLRSLDAGPHIVKIGAFTPGWGEVIAFWDEPLAMTVEPAE
jgi:hypothetical protein